MSLTVYDLIGGDMRVHASKDKSGDINIQIFDDENNLVFDERSAPAAWKSFVDVATQVINQNVILEVAEELQKDWGSSSNGQ